MKKSILLIILGLFVVGLIACSEVAVANVVTPTENTEMTKVTTTTNAPSQGKTKSETEGFLAGYKAIEVKLESLVGETFILSENQGKVIVLNFWASWCPPCNEEIPYFNLAYDEINDEEVMILGINLIDSDKMADVEAKIKEHDIRYPVFLDNRGIVANAYRVRNIPTTIIVKPNGVIHDVWVGALNKEQLLKMIEDAKK